VAGSDTALRLIQAEADSFMAAYKESRIQVAGGGTVSGIEALLNRGVDVAVLSRPPTVEERAIAKSADVDFALFGFANDGLALIVNRENPVYALAFDEARAVFSGEILDWAEVGGSAGRIRVYIGSVQGGAVGYARDTLLAGGDFVEGAGRAPTTAAIVDSVAAHADAIGFAGLAELDDRVKALPLSPKGGGPLTVLNVETVYEKTYPLVRTFYFATRGVPRGDLVSGFVSYVMGNAGQKIVLEHGFVPATVPLRIRHES
jgi:phosphate transport system substrate-binding protein